MSLFYQFLELSALRKNQQFMSFYLLFVNTLLVACTATFYIDLFGTEGLILKGYIISVFGLILLLPMMGKYIQNDPLLTFKIALGFEVISMVGYLMVANDYYPHIALPIATLTLVSSGLIMRPILTQVDSIVTNGCKDYSMLKSRLDALYTAIGAMVGAIFILTNVPPYLSLLVLNTSLITARIYRKRVLDEVYNKNHTPIAEKTITPL